MTDSSSPTFRKQFTKPIEEAALNVARKRLAHPLKIFVAGPYIKKDWTENEIKSQPSAAILRKNIVDYIESKRTHNVIFGEHRGVKEVGEELYRSMSSAMIFEFDLVRDSDAIIIIPASAGSFCELGSWSSDDSLCRKMLIFADRQYENDVNYLTLGVFKTTVNYGATLFWIDYSNLSETIPLVDKFVNAREDYALSRRAVNGR